MSAVGIYGIMHSLVAGRTREIGIRIALGARRSDATGLVMKEGMTVAGLGVTIGLLATVPLAGLMSRLVFGIGARDPLSIVAGGAALALTALVACWLPARRAARLDPMIALRTD
jgi:putative ABC transport system permease protein